MDLYELVLLKQGTRGDAVKKLQEKLGIGADGQFGPGTEKAVRDYQQKNGLAVDGAAGPATLAHMKLFEEITADPLKGLSGAKCHRRCGSGGLLAGGMLGITISRKAFRNIKVRRTAGNTVQNCRRYDCSSDLRSHVGRYVLCWEATSGGQPERDSWIEMASRDVPDGIRHGEYRQAEG
jgi:hypothetical protein